MKIVIVTLALLFSLSSFAQKSYQIENVSWEYQKPSNYKTRVDNFSSTIKKGDSVVRANNTLQNQSNSDVILFSLAKNDSANINILLASYSSGSNIARFTLKGYVDKLAELMKYNYQKINSDALVITKDITIDNIKFYILESRVYHKEKNFTYWTRLYIAEVGGKELNITVVFDNEDDKKAMEASVMSSKFHSL